MVPSDSSTPEPAEDLDPFAGRPRALGPDSINSKTLTAADVKPLEEKYIDG